MSLKLTTPPTVEPVDVAEAKSLLSISDDDNDSRLAMLLSAARRQAEVETGRALITQTWTMTLRAFPETIWLPRPPLQSVTSISYVDTDGATQTLASSVYRVSANAEPATIERAYNQQWPSTRTVSDAVTIVYVAGYQKGSVPEDIRLAIILMAAEWLNHPYNADDVSVREIPHNASWVLRKYKLGTKEAWAGLQV